MKTFSLLSLWCLAAMCEACTESARFDGDPSSVAFDAHVRYSCGEWLPAQPAGEWGLFDVHFGGPGVPEIATLGPTADQESRIREVGGVVVHVFNVPIIRAVLRPSVVADLDANEVVGVIDPDQLRILAHVRWDDDTSRPDSMLFVQLGGEQPHVGESITKDGQPFQIMIGYLPDSAVPLLRRHPAISLVETSGVRCN
jgi:hypothetical protein